jgi:hypothetical protein
MTVKAHLAELERQHRALEHEIAEAFRLSVRLGAGQHHSVLENY